MGIVFVARGVTAALDGYQIRLRVRSAISSTFQDARLTSFRVANEQAGFSALSYLTNAVNTTTRGIDLVIDAHHCFSDGSRLVFGVQPVCFGDRDAWSHDRKLHRSTCGFMALQGCVDALRF